ncbi:MAG: hemolysin III family protein [Xanthomonadaceae bacterium]|nr:hemolysin III family protein [Xanthomonadaceae bacterium]MDZ4116939.1 hemolysin III family protein [Xanthomonadaceae bacterium]MDZ4378647.1 hemolysin III family protein [Xanthomonadaceae bacterium]
MRSASLSREEIANALTHGLGAAASLTAGLVLVVLATVRGDGWQLASAIVFSAALVLLYSASTAYHASTQPTIKRRLKILDHAAIYVLIAATYTPFMLVSLRGPWGWSLFALIWTLAVAGVVFKLFYTGRFERTSTLLYLGMGWIAVLAAAPMMRALSTASLSWLFAGGLAYTVGTVFYSSRRIPYAHAIWHLFVLAGSSCHFVAVYSQVAV